MLKKSITLAGLLLFIAASAFAAIYFSPTAGYVTMSGNGSTDFYVGEGSGLIINYVATSPAVPTGCTETISISGGSNPAQVHLACSGATGTWNYSIRGCTNSGCSSAGYSITFQ